MSGDRQPFRALTSTTVVLPDENIDTDRIIPARFLTATGREGIGAGLFADWRRDAEGRERPDFPLNTPAAAGARVLVAGANFGCGSSREHAPWALLENGFRAVVSTGVADIFRANALKNGLLPVVVDLDTHRRSAQAGTGSRVTIDLESQTIELTDGTVAHFPIDPFSKYCLLHGIDELGYLLEQAEEIAAFEARHQT